jgi:flagellar hook-basal body complex protein FliE
MTVPAIAPIGVPALGLEPTAAAAAGPAGVGGFSAMLMEGVQRVDTAVLRSEAVTQAFLVDDTVPVHQVMFALEQARLATELLVQVRSRLVEGYQELMRMQL